MKNRALFSEKIKNKKDRSYGVLFNFYFPILTILLLNFFALKNNFLD